MSPNPPCPVFRDPPNKHVWNHRSSEGETNVLLPGRAERLRRYLKPLTAAPASEEEQLWLPPQGQTSLSIRNTWHRNHGRGMITFEPDIKFLQTSVLPVGDMEQRGLCILEPGPCDSDASAELV